MKSRNKIYLFLLILSFTTILSCQSPEVSELKNISDRELVELVEWYSSLPTDFEKFAKYMNFSSYENFLNFASSDVKANFVHDFNVGVETHPVVEKIYFLHLTSAEIDHLKTRFFRILENYNPAITSKSGKISVSCYDICYDASWGVYWDVFHANQSAGADMHSAHRSGMTARSFYYAGCSFGCMH